MAGPYRVQSPSGNVYSNLSRRQARTLAKATGGQSNEYQLRIERGLAKGKTRAQARGHGPKIVSRETIPLPPEEAGRRPIGAARTARANKDGLGPLGRQLQVKGTLYPAGEAIHRAWLDAGSPTLVRVHYYGLQRYFGKDKWVPAHVVQRTSWPDARRAIEAMGVESWLDSLIGGLTGPDRPAAWFGYVEIERS